MKPTAASILSKTAGGRAGNNIVDIIQAHTDPTEGDQLGAFVERNRPLIKEFVLVVCGFLIVIMIILFFALLAIILINRDRAIERRVEQQIEYKTAFLQNYDVRNRNRNINDNNNSNKIVVQ
ncbi:ORF-40 [Catopsilia pomona nucleopolyhedrovirus]|uniref:ORF-40 n=1 Tax=Catopsilia pomona nucleopolyhedrovirus TaxID=1850906 RepID=A0A172WZB1_9ABAC|nr:ORF-40 [Catopsilia pomona nucleopolyhedrovirus]ANF29688.1 ORF-40 [Catopsilia pomona nucleopolyhedrovirus]